MGEPWLRLMLAMLHWAWTSIGRTVRRGSATHIEMTVDRSNDKPTKQWVDTQWTRSGQRASHERTMGERANNEQRTCGETIASIQPTTCWQHSRFEIYESSADYWIERATSFSLGKHDLWQWTDSYCISDLKAIILSNILLKYEDDIDLVIPPTNADTIDTELRSIAAWALQNNLALNYAVTPYGCPQASIPSRSRVDRGCQLNQPSVWDEGPGRHFLWYYVTLASCKIFVRKIGTKCICASNSARSWSVWEGPMDSYSSPYHLTAHMLVPRSGFFVILVRGINLLWWSPDWQKRTICLQISQLSTKWWPLRTSVSSIKLSQTPPTFLLHLSHPQNHSYNLRKRPMTSRSLLTKLTF